VCESALAFSSELSSDAFRRRISAGGSSTAEAIGNGTVDGVVVGNTGCGTSLALNPGVDCAASATTAAASGEEACGAALVGFIDAFALASDHPALTEASGDITDVGDVTDDDDAGGESPSLEKSSTARGVAS
jgi:hypothetical protein